MKTDSAADLLSKIENKSIKVGVVGLGYVGLPLAFAFVSAGVEVLGFDVDPSKVEDLDAGRSYLGHLDQDLFDTLAASSNFGATSDMARLHEADAILVAVPTPLGSHEEPDLSYVTLTGAAIGRSLRPGQLVVLESTTYPGTTAGEFLDSILLASEESKGVHQSGGLFLAYSPEREDPGNAVNSQKIPKLVGGVGDVAGELATSLYRLAIDVVVPVSSAEVAESAKLLENIFRAVNIAMVNEMKIVLADMDIDIWEVIEAASTKPFGFMPFYPGPGLGGHCIPIDPFYLTWKAKEVNRRVQFIELAGLVNNRMPDYVVDRLVRGLNQHQKSLNGSKILILGLAYKPDVSDARESPSFDIIELIEEQGGHVSYSDPYIPTAPTKRDHNFTQDSTDLSPSSLAEFDAVIVVTDHSEFDYEMIAAHSKLVVDTRDALSGHAVAGTLIRA